MTIKTMPLSDRARERLVALIASHLVCDETELTPETRLREDLGADPLDRIEMVMLIEETFDLEHGGISEEVADRFRTFGDVAAYVAKHSRGIIS